MKISELLNKKNNNLDLIRIILACLVIVGHSPVLNGLTGKWADPISYFFPFTYSGSLAVKAFFFISGLVVTNSYLSKRNAIYFVISRVFRILPALLFVLLATVFLFGPILTTLSIPDYISGLDNLSYIYGNLIFKTQYYLPGLFANNPYPNAVNGSLWSLKYEMGCYIFLLVTFLLMGRINKYYLNIPIAFVVADALLETPILFSFLGTNPEISLLPMSFAIGCLFAVNADILMINLYVLLTTILFLLIFKDGPYAEIALVVTFCVLITYISSRKSVIKLRPSYDISYGIYLWGFLIQQTIVYVTGTIYVGLHCLLALLISVVLAFISYIYIEKPSIAFGKKVFHMLKTKMPLSLQNGI